MKLYSMIGYKLYNEREDGSIHMIRIVGMHRPFKITEKTKDPSEITIYDYETKERKKVRVDSLKEYSPLKPDGVLTLSIVTVLDNKGNINKDVIVSATKYLEIELGISTMPYAVCRQSITDVFYNLLCYDESDMIVGLAINRDTCPSNFDFRIMFAANSVEYSDYINFYRNDKLEDLYYMVNLNKFNDVLKELYEAHVKYIKKPELLFKSEDGGWCKDIKTLLTQNNFQSDINQMLGITDVDFKIEDYLESVPMPNSDTTYNIAREDFKYWLSLTFKVNISEAAFMEYDHDINLGDFNDNKYFLLRDNTDKLYLAVYTESGEYYESDLKAKEEQYDFSTKFRINFYNKYNRDNK